MSVRAINILEWLEEAVKKHPDQVAIRDEKNEMTYGQLDERRKRIGSMLAKELTAVNQPICVMIDRNIESLATFLGITTSRNFYVPIDATQPVGRIAVILQQMQPAAMITIGDNLPEGIEGLDTVKVLRYEELAEAEIDPILLEKRRNSAMDTDPLYAICTSGSTGVPKGVLISQRSVLDFIPVFTETFQFSEEDRFGNQAPFDFDVSVKDIYSVLYLGATLYIIPRKNFSFPKKLIACLNEQRISVIVWAVSALCIVSSLNGFKKDVPHDLKKVLFSGEVMPVKMLNIWRENLPDAMFVNLYGPTEITCNCMYYIVDREFSPEEFLPLGTAFRNEEVLILNEENQPVKPGETGEICVKGTCLALGYYRNPEKTKEAFVQNPLNDAYPERMYRTGDLARLSENGEYFFAARKDFQIKHMGHRIELEEIESHVGAADGVTRACCIFREDKNKIYCYYTGTAEAIDIINSLKAVVPKYMIPNVFILVDQMPLTKNGKIDRRELRKIENE